MKVQTQLLKSACLFLVLNCSFQYILFSQNIASGGRHSIAICADSSVMTWGYNGFGQLGIGNQTEQHSGSQIPGFTSVVKVAGGLFHSLFIKSDSTVWACGRNQPGNLGDGSFTNRSLPVQVQGLTQMVQVAGGGEHSLFLKNDGTVWACGANPSGQLGDGTNVSKNIAVNISGLSDIVQLAAGAEFSLFLDKKGQIWACGHNGYGQFGNGTTTSSKSPIKVAGLSDIVQITAGEWHSIFVKKDGSVYAAGRNNYGQLGDGTTIDKKTAIQIISLSNVVKAEAGGIHSVFVKNDGTVWSCGLNSGGNNDGQLGDGSVMDKHTPVRVLPEWGNGKVVDAHATREHSIYLIDNGELWGSGRNNYGQLATGAFTNLNSSRSVRASTVCTTPFVSSINSWNMIRAVLYPNPVTSHVTISTDVALNNAELTVYNLLGQIVKKISNINGSKVSFSIENLLNGIYVIRLMQNDRIIYRDRVIIED